VSLPIAILTGAPGWLGTNLAVMLRARDGARPLRCLVHPAFDARARSELPPSAERVSGDVTDAGSLGALFDGAAGATVFHSAGVIHPQRVADFYAVNTEGTRNLIAAAQRAGVARFVHVSSNSAVGCNDTPERLLDEDSPCRPYMNYGRSKLLAEEIVREAGRHGAMQTVIVRAPWFYGPGQPARQTRFFTMIRRGLVPLVAGGRSMRSMAYTDNLCEALLLCESRPQAAGRTYWIADRRPYAMREVVDTVERLMADEFGLSVARRRVRLPGAVSDVAYAADLALQNIGRYNQEVHVLSEMNKHIACSIDRAVRELGYAPTVELEEGMRRSLRWMLDRGITP
jgi:nucleoside-diphosphate-sugar epimerase